MWVSIFKIIILLLSILLMLAANIFLILSIIVIVYPITRAIDVLMITFFGLIIDAKIIEVREKQTKRRLFNRYTIKYEYKDNKGIIRQETSTLRQKEKVLEVGDTIRIGYLPLFPKITVVFWMEDLAIEDFIFLFLALTANWLIYQIPFFTM